MRKRERDRLYADLLKHASTADVDAAIEACLVEGETAASLAKRTSFRLAAAIIARERDKGEA